MAIDPEAYLNKTHTGRFVGAKGNEGMAVYNPETGGYERYTIEDWNQMSRDGRRESGENIAHHYTNRFGENVYGYRPTETHTGMLGGESFVMAGKDPYADKYIRNDNGTSVPGTSTLNPDFVEPESRFQTRSGDAKISYAAPTPEQAAWENKIANFNPEERALWESNVSGMLTGMLNDTQPATPGQDVAPIDQGPTYTGQEAFDFARDYANRFHAGKGDAEQHRANMDEAKAFSQDSSLLQALGDHAIETKTGVQEFLNTARSLHMYNPAAFEEWERANPEMALRYHARAAAGNGQVGGIEGYNHAERAQALSYGISQQLGYGQDGKQDGRAIAYDFDQFNDVNTENGDGDFWKLGTAQTFTNDLSDYIENNPLEVAAMVASVAIPFAAPAVAGGLTTLLGTNVSTAMASGILNTGLSLVGGADLDEALLSGLKAYGFSDLGGRITDGLKDIVGALDPKVLEMMNSTQAGIEQGVTTGDILQGGWELGNLGVDLANEANDYGNNSDPTIISEHVEGNVTPESEESGGGGGGGAESGSGGPAAPTGGNSEGGGTGAQDGSGDTPWVYEGEGVFRNENTGATRTEDEYEGAVVGDNYGFGDDPLDNNPTPPTPNEDLPEGYEWVMTQGTWTLNGPNGETISQQELAEQIYGSLVTGTGTTGGTSGTGSHPGVVGGIHAGTGQSVLGDSGTGGGTGTGTGTGSGDGDGDGSGDGDGEGSGTPLADGLMGMLGGGTNVPMGLVDIPQVAPVQTRPLDWSFLRKVSEGRG